METGIILVAGRGSRLLDLTSKNPKCLLKIKGKTILERLLDCFRLAGFKRVVLVIGYRGGQIVKKIGYSYGGMEIKYIDNYLWKSTNNMFSLWLASHYIVDGCVFSNGDNFLDYSLIKKLVDSPFDNAVLVDDAHAVDEESMKVKFTKGKFQGFSKAMPVKEAKGEFCGVVKVSRRGAKKLVRELDNHICVEGKLNDWFEMAFKPGTNWQMVSTDGKTFVEIDFEKDLKRAIKLCE